MDKGLVLGTALAIFFGFLPYAVKSMPVFLSWSGIAVGMAIAVIAILPSRMQPTLVQSALYITSIGLFAATMGLQRSASNDPAKAAENTAPKGARVMMEKDRTAAEQKPGTIVGTDIINSGGEVGMEINSSGTEGSPSIGGETIVHAPQGQNAIGTRVIQNGPGVGLRVIQNGPGVGYRSVVIVGQPATTQRPDGSSDK